MAAFVTGLEGLIEKVARMSPPRTQAWVGRLQDRWGGQHPGLTPEAAVAHATPRQPPPPVAKPMVAMREPEKGPGLLGRGLRAMALPGLVAGAAAGAALVHENEQDAKKYRQVYAPMGPGSVYGD